MDPIQEHILQSRRSFLASAASGLGTLSLATLLREEGLLAAETPGPAGGPGVTRQPHFAPKARSCIFFFMGGAPSQLDLFDPKPRLNELHGQKLPDSLMKDAHFAFIQKETATLLGSPRKFKKHGQCGMELSDLLPHLGTVADEICLIRSMHTDAFNHHPGQLMLNTGAMTSGRPGLGAWLSYGLGSASQNLPGYVVLTAGRGLSGGAGLWRSGFLPSNYQGILFRNQGEPVIGLSDSLAATPEMHALRDLNRLRDEQLSDPEIASRLAAYEQAFRMQTAAPELMDFSDEKPETLAAYGVDRDDPDDGSRGMGCAPGVYRTFATNCLFARRLVERGVRFVNVYHASWDHHRNLNRDLAFNAGMADQPIAALIKDLKQRGLLETTLVVFASEFGRTPLGENRVGFREVTGRDHHPLAFSIWMAGGGIRGGQVIGETDELGWSIMQDPIHINDLHATILHLFGLDHTRLTYRFQGRDVRLTDTAGRVIHKLLA